MRAAYRLEPKQGMARLKKLAEWLEQEQPAAAASLREDGKNASPSTAWEFRGRSTAAWPPRIRLRARSRVCACRRAACAAGEMRL